MEEMKFDSIDEVRAFFNGLVKHGAIHDYVFNDKDEIPFDGDDKLDCDERCDHCEYAYECGNTETGELDYEPDMWGIPDIDNIIFSGPATIVFWTDGTKTVVKAMAGEKIERYAGFAAACMKKMFGSTSRAKSIMNELATDQPVSKKKTKEHDVLVPDLTEAFANVIANRESCQEAMNEAFVRQ